jgi:uncharacterized protein YebE (UPF0316 family)
MTGEILTMIIIFFARVVDVSLGTIRIILISRGYRYLAPVIGFVEILVWLLAISSALQNLNSIYSYIIYAAGFATGNYLGMVIEAKLAIGYQAIRIITSRHLSALPLHLWEEGFGVTSVEGQGMKGPVNILYTVIPKKKVKKMLDTIQILEPDAFITIEDISSRLRGFVSTGSFENVLRKQRLVKKK